MEMTYDGTLVMPSSYVVMEENEMMYLEGGAYISNRTLKAVIYASVFNPIGATLWGLGFYAAIGAVKRMWTAACAALGAIGGAVGIDIGFTWRPTFDVK